MLNIKELRKAQGMTQEQLAKLIGVTQGAISQWEEGLTHPAFSKLRKLATALGVTMDDLIGEEVEHAS